MNIFVVIAMLTLSALIGVAHAAPIHHRVDGPIAPFGNPSLIEFQKLIRDNPNDEIVVELNSTGGSVEIAGNLNKAIASHGNVIAVVRSGEVCLSACATIWLSAQSRVMESGSRIGFHSSWSPATVNQDMTRIEMENFAVASLLSAHEPLLAKKVFPLKPFDRKGDDIVLVDYIDGEHHVHSGIYVTNNQAKYPKELMTASLLRTIPFVCRSLTETRVVGSNHSISVNCY